MKIATRALAGLCLAAVVTGAPLAAQTGPEGARTTPPSHGQRDGNSQERRTHWWRDAAVQRELDMSERQVAKIEKIWTTNLPPIRELYKQFDILEKEADRLIRENTADEKVLAALLDRMEPLRGQISKARTLMLYRMHQALTPEQYRKLSDINERRRKERGRR